MQGQQSEGYYTTLSHCWGDPKKVFRLTSENHKRLTYDGFSFAELPKTFRDAVRLSRFLGVGYIWIDSLCIIQDDEEDWLKESKVMADVYRHSKCNIAATASQAPTEGCFYDRDPELVSPLETILCPQETEDDSSTERYLFLDPRSWNDSVETAPLNKRAWVVQERTLAPRQIHCGETQLLWECHETVASETFPFMLNKSGYEFETFRTKKPPSVTPVLLDMSRLLSSDLADDKFPSDISYDSLLHRYDRGGRYVSEIKDAPAGTKGTTWDKSVSLLRHSIYENWANIVNQYSGCKSTKRTDKLIAVHGIVSQIQDVLKGRDHYVAGLWQSQLPWQLLWIANQKGLDASPDRTPAYDIAPSWSWACLNIEVYSHTPIINWQSEFPVLIDINEVRKPHTIDRAKDCSLKLRCHLYQIHASQGERAEASIQLGHGKFTFEFDPGLILMDNLGTIDLREKAYLMPVMKMFHLEGLVVRPCGERPGHYRRIGKWDEFETDFFERARVRATMLSAQEESKVTITLI